MNDLTKMELFSLVAMNAMLSKDDRGATCGDVEDHVDLVGCLSVKYADSVMKTLHTRNSAPEAADRFRPLFEPLGPSFSHRYFEARAKAFEERIDSIVDIAKRIFPEVRTLNDAWDAMAASRMDAQLKLTAARKGLYEIEHRAGCGAMNPCADIADIAKRALKDSEVWP